MSVLCSINARNLFSVKLRPAISHEYICFQELSLLTVRRLVPDIGQKPVEGSLVVADKSYLHGTLITTGSSKGAICLGIKRPRRKTLCNSHKAWGLRYRNSTFFKKKKKAHTRYCGLLRGPRVQKS